MTGEQPMMRVRHRGPSPRVRRNRRIATVVAVVILVGAVVGAIFLLTPRGGTQPAPSPTPSDTATPTPTPTPTPTFPMDLYSIDDPNSLWVVVNKQRPLDPLTFSPPDIVEAPVLYANAPLIRAEVSDKIVEMFAAYEAETGRQMQLQSAYRSYDAQVRVYNGWVSSVGQEAADLRSARPGHSEHQTGLTIDVSSVPAVCPVEACFANTPEAAWLRDNGWRFGFIVRYPDGYTEITGYQYEPWHMRYVGLELSTEMHETGIMTLEEFFGLPAAPTY